MNKKRENNRVLYLGWFGTFGISILICLSISIKFETQLDEMMLLDMQELKMEGSGVQLLPACEQTIL